MMTAEKIELTKEALDKLLDERIEERFKQGKASKAGTLPSRPTEPEIPNDARPILQEHERLRRKPDEENDKKTVPVNEPDWAKR